MAYYNSNPDALPAHAEPEQAAQMMSGYQEPPQQRPGSRPPANMHQQPPGGYGKPISPRPDTYSQHGSPQPGYGRPTPQGFGGHQQGPPQNAYASPPPPGSGPGGYGQRPPPNSRPPPTPAPPQGADPQLYPLFKAVDKDGSGQLSEKELRAALVNGDWTSFDPHTVRMMIRMFDTDQSSTISFNEFCGLWGFLAAWRSLFDRFDTDRSGNISYDEFSNALAAFGYRLSPQFVQLLFRSYDRRGQNAISFDLFVQSCISLKRMTEVFKKYDDDRDGFITLSFEEFLTEILRQR
ncbi:hypothetical protein EDC01DRAFT_649417 [Geopyxis carbonaria]|nr:hypothetical protein EDC01DRAFT_649417 [Geopyxis carbonaria]